MQISAGFGLSSGCADPLSGAHVKLVELVEPVSLEFEATGDRFRIENRAGASSLGAPSDPWRNYLVIEPRRDRAITLNVTPQVTGKSRLSVQHDAAWVQRVDLEFEVSGHLNRATLRNYGGYNY